MKNSAEKKQKPRANSGIPAPRARLNFHDFEPPRLLRNPFFQSFLASFSLPGKHEVERQSKEVLLDAGKNVRLLGRHAISPVSRGLLILVHGWLGGSESAYVRRAAQYFYSRGFDIFRINLRDHGGTHFLNEGAFNGSLLVETHEAVIRAARLAQKKPVYLAGFSLGGNFVLRMALRHSTTDRKIPGLKHTVAVSPAVDPMKATLLMDRSFIMRRYFLKKWMHDLQLKRAAFPDKYSLENLNASSVMELTDKIIPRYTEFPDANTYFRSYTLSNKQLSRLKNPTTILTSADDPIIDPGDIANLGEHRYLSISVQKYGGHNGFMQSLLLDPWYHGVMEKILNR